MSPRPPLALWPVAAIALAEVGVLLAFAGGYGYHRDELYFREAGQHLDWGYDDQPPLTPLIGRAFTAVFGDTVTALRVPSALALAACVLLTGLICRELGGGRRAQVVAAASIAAAAGTLFLGHILSTATFDFLAWTALLYLVVRLLRGADPRLWLVVGVAAGIALQSKWLVLLLFGALAAGIAAARRWDLVRTRWMYAGALIALLIWAPNLIWQADQAWPQRELSGQIADEDPAGARAIFVPFQLLIIGPLLAPVWIAGLVWLLRDEAARPFRALAFGYIALVGICLVTAGKIYYAVGWYPVLIAAGGVVLDGWLRTRGRVLLLGAAVALSALVSALIALPIVPRDSLADTPIPDLNEDVIETVGWPAFVDSVARVERRLPGRPVVFTANYAEAGAIDRFGPSRGLPRPYSGHNSYSSFGRPPGRAGPVVAVGFEDRGYLARFFPGCRLATRHYNGLGLDNEEQGAPIWVCRGPRRPWRDIWDDLHHLDA